MTPRASLLKRVVLSLVIMGNTQRRYAGPIAPSQANLRFSGVNWRAGFGTVLNMFLVRSLSNYANGPELNAA